jgi:hypothetical protein
MNKTKAIIAALMLAAIAALSGCGGSSEAASGGKPTGTAEPETFMAVGTIDLTDSDLQHYDDECSGGGGYDDITGGAQVVVYDNAGTMLASGALEPGEPDPSFPDVACSFGFTVEVPVAAADLYSVEIGHRGKVTFTQDGAADLSLTLG